jgi:hypothetical protein
VLGKFFKKSKKVRILVEIRFYYEENVDSSKDFLFFKELFQPNYMRYTFKKYNSINFVIHVYTILATFESADHFNDMMLAYSVLNTKVKYKFLSKTLFDNLNHYKNDAFASEAGMTLYDL